MNNESLKTLNFAHIALIATFAALGLYERIRTKFSANYAKQTQSQVLRNCLSSLTTNKYGTGTFGEMRKQTQYKPNSKPIQTQSKPILAQKLGWQTQFKPNQSQSCPAFSERSRKAQFYILNSNFKFFAANVPRPSHLG